MTPEELEAERLRLQAEASTNPMMQPTNLIGQQAPQEDVNPLALAGLGGAAAFQGMFPFASEPTASNIIGRNLPAGGVNPQVTGPVSQGLFQSSNIIGRNLPAGGANPQVTGPVSRGSLRPAPNQPVLIGQPQSYQGVPTGPNTPPQFTGTNTGRLTPGTQIVPQTQVATINQPPAVQSSGLSTTAKPGVKPTASSYGYSVNTSAAPQAKPSVMKNVASGLFKAGAIGALTTPNTMGDGTISGAYDSRVAAGEDPNAVRIDLGLDADYGDEIQLIDPSENPVLNPELNAQSTPTVADVILGKQARGPDATFTPDELAQISSIQSTDQANSAQFVQDYQAGQMGIAKSLQDLSNVDDLRAVEAQLAEKGIVRDLATPFLDGAKSIGEANAISSFTPRSTFTQADGRIMQEDEFGQQREITADQLQQFEGDMAQLGQPTAFTAPMGRDATRARLGGMTLNQYLNAPGGAEGVSGLRTDPQGRMIPAGAPGTSQTRADAYGQYEDEVSQAYQRQSNRMQQLADQRDGTAGPRTYGGYTTSQLRGMVGGGDNLRAAQMRAEAGLNPITGNREKTEAERAQSEQQGQLQNEVLQARLDSFQQTDPDKLSKAQAYAERLGLTGDSATAFIFSQMGTSMDDIFGLGGTGAGGGGGVGNANIPQSAIDYLKNNPDAASDFDAKYGAGSSGKYLT